MTASVSTHTSPDQQTRSSAGAPVRPARRHQRPGWRDPRILVGLVIVAGSVLLGVKVLAAADDTVAVWALGRDLPAGTRVAAGDVKQVRVRFTDAASADRYLSAEDALPRDRVLDRAVDAGELLPRAALVGEQAALVEVPVPVGVDDVPVTVREGSVVDVWVTPQTAATADDLSDATRVLDDVVVVRAPGAADSLAPSGTRQIVVGVDPDRADALGTALGQLATGHVVIARQR